MYTYTHTYLPYCFSIPLIVSSVAFEGYKGVCFHSATLASINFNFCPESQCSHLCPKSARRNDIKVNSKKLCMCSLIYENGDLVIAKETENPTILTMHLRPYQIVIHQKREMNINTSVMWNFLPFSGILWVHLWWDFNTKIHFATEACLWYIFTKFLRNIHTDWLVDLLMSLPTWSTSCFTVNNRFKAHEYPMKQREIYQKYCEVQLE